MNKKLPKALIIAGVALLGLSAGGSAMAALNYVSDNYIAQMDLKSVGVTLNENGTAISYRNYNHKDDSWSEATGELLTTMLSDAGDDQLVLNKRYTEELSVTNSGTIDEYVRVQVYHYWAELDADGNEVKRTDVDPDMIVIGFTNDGWVEDTSAQTAEKNVLYYTSVLESGETSSLFADTLYISGQIAYKVTESTDTETRDDGKTYTVITSTYDYDGTYFVLRADVDAVQTHNAQEAILSAWGVNVTIDEATGKLSLGNE